MDEDISAYDELKDDSCEPKRKKVKVKPCVALDAVPEKRPITLYPSQETHFVKIQDILSKHKFALDFSMLGAGKTYTSSKLALDNPDKYKHVIVICPVSVQGKWKSVSQHHGLPLRHIFSQQSLRSQRCKQPTHGLLSRRDFVKKQLKPGYSEAMQDPFVEINKVEFRPTDMLHTYISEGLLVVIDEIQNIKNISDQFLACQAFMKPILNAPAENSSRCLLLSGSPIDRKEHAVHLFRSVGIQKTDQLARINLQTQSMEWTGLEEIRQFCEKLDRTTLQSLQTPSRRATDWYLIDYVYKMFQQIFKKHCASHMMPPPIASKVVKRNAFYKVSDLTVLQRGVALLRNGAGQNDSTGTVDGFSGNSAAALSAINAALQVIETGKIDMLCRVGLEALDSWPNQKVVICVNYSETIKDLRAFFESKGHTVVCLKGSMTESQRTQAITSFQEPSRRVRMLIGNQSVCSTGIDLDDKDGNQPRVCFVSPNQNTITAFQLGHRFLRADTKSDATVHFVYGKSRGAWNDSVNENCIELRVLNALARKSTIMKETTPEQSSHGVIFPCDHEVFDE